MGGQVSAINQLPMAHRKRSKLIPPSQPPSVLPDLHDAGHREASGATVTVHSTTEGPAQLNVGENFSASNGLTLCNWHPALKKAPLTPKYHDFSQA